MKLFFNYSLDCELPPDGTFGGPASWADAEASTRGFVELMDNLNILAGASLFVYPDVAQKQRSLFRELAGQGIEIALHLNTMRYSRMKMPAWLGSLGYEEQIKTLEMAKAELEEATAKPCLGFRSCYASANHNTFPALQAAGFIWSSTSASGSYNPQVYARWAGGWPFPYHPSAKNMLVPGSLSIYEMPVTRGIHTHFENNPDRPLDLRAETSLEASGPFYLKWRQIIEDSLLEMEKRDQPVRLLAGASHNTNPYQELQSLARQNVSRVCSLARETVERKGFDFVPASFNQIYQTAAACTKVF